MAIFATRPSIRACKAPTATKASVHARSTTAPEIGAATPAFQLCNKGEVATPGTYRRKNTLFTSAIATLTIDSPAMMPEETGTT